MQGIKLIVLAVAICVWGCATNTEMEVHATTPYDGKPHAIPGLIEAEHFDEGGPGVAYVDVDEVNHGASYRGETQIDIEQRGDASNGYGIGWVREGEWISYTAEVSEDGLYSVKIPVASDGQGGSFHIESDGEVVSEAIVIPDTGAWTQLTTLEIHGLRLKQGRQVIRLVMDADGETGGIGDIDCMVFAKSE